MMVEVYKGSLPWSNIGDMNQVGWSVNAFWSLELMSLIFRSETTRNVDSPTSLLMCDAKLWGTWSTAALWSSANCSSTSTLWSSTPGPTTDGSWTCSAPTSQTIGSRSIHTTGNKEEDNTEHRHHQQTQRWTASSDRGQTRNNKEEKLGTTNRHSIPWPFAMIVIVIVWSPQLIQTLVLSSPTHPCDDHQPLYILHCIVLYAFSAICCTYHIVLLSWWINIV